MDEAEVTTILPVAGECSYPEAWSVVLGMCLSFVAVIGVIGNILTIAAFIADRTLRYKPANLFLLSLSCADLLVGLVIPVRVPEMFCRTWLFGVGTCQFHIVFLDIGAVAGFLSMSSIALDRYLLISRQYSKYLDIQSQRNVCLTVVVIWSIAATVTVVEMTLWNTVDWEDVNGESYDYYHECVSPPRNNRVFAFTLFSITFLIPIVCVVGLSLRFLVLLRRRLQEYRSTPGARTGNTSIETTCTLSRDNADRLEATKETPAFTFGVTSDSVICANHHDVNCFENQGVKPSLTSSVYQDSNRVTNNGEDEARKDASHTPGAVDEVVIKATHKIRDELNECDPRILATTGTSELRHGSSKRTDQEISIGRHLELISLKKRNGSQGVNVASLQVSSENGKVDSGYSCDPKDNTFTRSDNQHMKVKAYRPSMNDTLARAEVPDESHTGAVIQLINNIKSLPERMKRRYVRPAIIMITLVSCFLLCTLPYMVFISVVIKICPDCDNKELRYHLCNILILNSFVNPFVYAATHPKIRKFYQKVLYGTKTFCFGKRLLAP